MGEKGRILSLRTLLMLLIFIVFIPMLPLIISWEWDWWEAWIYAAVSIFGFVISRYFAGRKDPGLLVE
jgi:uncharacterized membrane protein (DUF485 family)